MQRSFMLAAAMAATTTIFVTPAFAHITLEGREAAVGGSYRAVLRVPHGCGTEATTGVRVSIPEGFEGAQPMPKAGWDLSTTVNDAGVVTEITWSGGNLPDAWYDEFVFRGTFSADLEVGSTFYFPVIQQCSDLEEPWIGRGEEGGEPAPSLTLIEGSGEGQGH